MPPRLYSRYMFCVGLRDEQERFYLSERDPFVFQNFPDNRTHVVADGETLWSLAARYFQGFEDPALLWWIIADFQPDAESNPAPIFDPTIALAPGTKLVIPSIQTVQNEIFHEQRRDLQ